MVAVNLRCSILPNGKKASSPVLESDFNFIMLVKMFPRRPEAQAPTKHSRGEATLRVRWYGKTYKNT